MKVRNTIILSLALIVSSFMAQAQQLTPLQEKVKAAMASNIRTADELARDANRMPVEILDFFRLEDDMKVMELIPFSGWYSKLLAQVLDDNGKLYLTQPEIDYFSAALEPTLALPGMEKVSLIDWNGRAVAEGEFGLVGSGAWDVEPLDMVLTFRNYHNFGYEDRMAINKSAFDALKSGGYYGVIDHTRRHMEADSQANGRRVDPVLAIMEIQETGFVLEDYTDLLARPQDALELEVGQPAVTGQTDRFTLLFRKP